MKRSPQKPAPPPQIAAVKSQPVWLNWLFLLLTPALVILAFEPYALWPLIFVALVPWTLALCRLHRRGLAYFAALFSFALEFFILTGWLSHVTIPGHFATAIIQTIYLLPVVIAIRFLHDRTRLPMTLILPVVWTAGEYFRGLGLTGFPWFYLGHALYRQLWAIQICDLAGVYLLSFAVAQVNGLVVDLVLNRRLTGPTGQGAACQPSGDRVIGGSGDLKSEPASFSNHQITRSPDHQIHQSAIGNGQSAMAPSSRSWLVINASIVLATWLAIALYGWYRLDESKTTMSSGPVLAVIQDDLPMTVDSDMDVGMDKMLGNMALLSEAAARHRPAPDLIAWPESMVMTNLNPEFLQADLDLRLAEALLYPEVKDYCAHQPDKMIAFAKKEIQKKAREHYRLICDLCDRLNAPLLVGFTAVVPVPPGGQAVVQRFNSTALFAPQSGLLPGRHDKLRCVPIGETVPFRYTAFHWLYRLINDYATPFGIGGYDYSLDEGTTLQIFTLQVPSTASQPATAAYLPTTEPSNYPASRPCSASAPNSELRAPVLELKTQNSKLKTFHFATPICFESTFAPYVRLWAAPQDGRKGVDFLINVSNDGWFLRGSELLQHLMICSFRAVEGRVGIARAVNTGISAFVKPTGEIYGYVRQKPNDPASPFWTGLGTPESGLCAQRQRLREDREKLLDQTDTDTQLLKKEFVDLTRKIKELTTQIDQFRAQAGVRGVSVQPVYVDSRQTLYVRFGDVFAGTLLTLLFAVQFAAWHFWVKKTPLPSRERAG